MCPLGDRNVEGPRYADDGRARTNGSSAYGYAYADTSVFVVNTDARSTSVDGLDASGVDGAGSVNVKLCTVDAG